MAMRRFGKPSPLIETEEVEEPLDEANTVNDELEAFLSNLTAVDSFGVAIYMHSSHCQFSFRCYKNRGGLTEVKTGERNAYFRVLDHISSSTTIKELEIELSTRHERDPSTNRIEVGGSLDSLDECLQEEVAHCVEAFWGVIACNQGVEEVGYRTDSWYGDDVSRTTESLRELEFGIATWISKALSENKTMSTLRLYLDGYMSVEAAHVLSMGLVANRTLRSLGLFRWKLRNNLTMKRGDAMNVFLQPFRDNHNDVLEELRFSFNMDGDEVEHIAAMLMTNKSLKRLKIWGDHEVSVRNGMAKIGDALSINTSLEAFLCSGTALHPEECERLFKPLMEGDDTGRQVNTTLKTLRLYDSKIGEAGFEYLITMLQHNASLVELAVGGVDVLGAHYDEDKDEEGCQVNVCRLLDSLKGHPSLECLGLFDTTGVSGDKVLGAFLDLLLENYHIQEVNLRGSSLDFCGSTQQIYTELEWRRKEKSSHLIKDMAKVHTNSGRIFLCGDGEAGKTTLCTTLKDVHTMKISSQIQNPLPLSSSKVRTEVQERTRGIEVHNLSYADMDLTIWDMAGQEEFHSFHDLVIPNLSGAGSSCTFILVCDPFGHTGDEIKSKLRYWLQFIASNTRKSRSYRPHVTIVMTHNDLWRGEGRLFYALIEEEVEALKEQFKDLLEFDIHRSFYPMDARQPDEIAVELFESIIGQMGALLAKLPKVLKACFELQAVVKDWNMTHPNQPFVRWDTFSSICEQVEELKATAVDMELVERRRKLVALALHDGGHIIYNVDTGFVIMNPHWFCHDVMGELLWRFSRYLCARWSDGIISKGAITGANFRRILSELNAIGDENHAYIEDFVCILMKLQICYDQGDDTLMVPSTLPSSGEVLKWSASEGTMSYSYVGRRLIPQDIHRTILSAGFFPRLQVYFRGKLLDDNTKKSYRLTRDTIFFIQNGKEVFIEYDGHIDVMVRATQNKDVLIQFLHDEVFSVIYDLLRNPTLGCPGVVLVECVVRPLCVRRLSMKEQRRDQYVVVESLKRDVLECYDLDYNHNWIDAGNGELEPGYDNARDLLSEKEWKNVLKRRGRALEEIGAQVLSNLSLAVDSGEQSEIKPQEEASNTIEKTLSRIHSLKRIVVGNHLEMKNMLGDIRSTVQRQDQMLYQISASITEMMDFSVELQRAQIPKLACLAFRTKNGKRQLLTRMIPGLTKCTLHFFCEHVYGIHEVENQEGHPVYFGTKDTRRVLCLIRRGLNVATILAKVAAHVGGGMGSVVPNLAQGASLMLDTPGLLDCQLSDQSNLHILSQGLDTNETITDEDMKSTERWLIDQVKSRQNDIYKMFGLNKVKYNRLQSGNQMKIPSVAWVCDKHKSQGLEVGMLESLSY